MSSICTRRISAKFDPGLYRDYFFPVKLGTCFNLSKNVGRFKCRLEKVYIVTNNNIHTSKIIKSKHCYISMKT